MDKTIESVFRHCVSCIFERWSALKIAVDQGFGGVDSQQKASWLIDVVVDFFRDNDDIEDWELEEFLEDIMNAEFNLVRDANNDGTDISLVSGEVCRAFSQCRQGRSSELLSHYQSLPCPPAPQVHRDKPQMPAAPTDEDVDSSDDDVATSRLAHTATTSASNADSSVCPSSSTHTRPSEASSQAAANMTSPMDEDEGEGWTVVKRHRRT